MRKEEEEEDVDKRTDAHMNPMKNNFFPMTPIATSRNQYPADQMI